MYISPNLCYYIYETDLLCEKYVKVICKILLRLWNFKEVLRRESRDGDLVKPTDAQRNAFHSFPLF